MAGSSQLARNLLLQRWPHSFWRAAGLSSAFCLLLSARRLVHPPLQLKRLPVWDSPLGPLPAGRAARSCGATSSSRWATWRCASQTCWSRTQARHRPAGMGRRAAVRSRCGGQRCNPRLAPAPFARAPPTANASCRPIPASSLAVSTVVPHAPQKRLTRTSLPAEYMYRALDDSDLSVRKNAVMVLTHLILNDMMKVGGRGRGWGWGWQCVCAAPSGGRGCRARGRAGPSWHCLWLWQPRTSSLRVARKCGGLTGHVGTARLLLVACFTPLLVTYPHHVPLLPGPGPAAGQGPHRQDGSAAGGR